MKAPDIKTPILKDGNGKPSGKRIAGFIILSIGLGFMMSIGITAIFHEIRDSATALAVGNTFMYVGGGLLGLGVFEGLKK